MASLRKKGKVWYVRVRDESGRQREVKAGPFSATRPGFEPGKTGPKPVVIPFHHRVMEFSS